MWNAICIIIILAVLVFAFLAVYSICRIAGKLSQEEEKGRD